MRMDGVMAIQQECGLTNCWHELESLIKKSFVPQSKRVDALPEKSRLLHYDDSFKLMITHVFYHAPFEVQHYRKPVH